MPKTRIKCTKAKEWLRSYCVISFCNSATRIFIGIKIKTAHYNSMTVGCSLTRQRKKAKSKKRIIPLYRRMKALRFRHPLNSNSELKKTELLSAVPSELSPLPQNLGRIEANNYILEGLRLLLTPPTRFSDLSTSLCLGTENQNARKQQ